VFPSCLPQNPSRARAGNRHWSAATYLFGRLSVSPSVRPSVRRLYYPPAPEPVMAIFTVLVPAVKCLNSGFTSSVTICM
jgi:hypothetical protein